MQQNASLVRGYASPSATSCCPAGESAICSGEDGPVDEGWGLLGHWHRHPHYNEAPRRSGQSLRIL